MVRRALTAALVVAVGCAVSFPDYPLVSGEVGGGNVGNGGHGGNVGNGGNGGAGLASLGAACGEDAECQDGLECWLADSSNDGPAGGMCTTLCNEGNCADINGVVGTCDHQSGYCVETCTYLSANPESQCHGRHLGAGAHVGCAAQEHTVGLDADACLPRCNPDAMPSQCPAETSCSRVTGLCEGDLVERADLYGDACGADENCRGTCSGAEGTCEERCVVGVDQADDWCGDEGRCGFVYEPDGYRVGNIGACGRFCYCDELNGGCADSLVCSDGLCRGLWVEPSSICGLTDEDLLARYVFEQGVEANVVAGEGSVATDLTIVGSDFAFEVLPTGTQLASSDVDATTIAMTGSNSDLDQGIRGPQLTLELVFTVDLALVNAGPGASYVMHVGDGEVDSWVLTASQPLTNQPIVLALSSREELYIEWNVQPQARSVCHVVVDEDQAPGDQVSIYMNGVEIVPFMYTEATTSLQVGQGILSFMNVPGGGPQSFQGGVAYAALYDTGLAQERLVHHARILELWDDSPDVR